MNKKLIAVLLVAILALGTFAGCGNKENEADEEIELIVFAAASMTETMNQIKELYETANPGVKITYTFDSSGTLKTQIQEGAPCDIFISAAQKQMNQLDITADPSVNTEGLDFVISDTRINLLENKVALAVDDQNTRGITSFDDLINLLKDDTLVLGEGEVLLCIGDADVPVGAYTLKIFAYYGIEEAAIASKITYGQNVKAVTTAVSEGTADCGIIYQTDAYSAKLTVVDTATAEMCGQVIYPAAVLNTTTHEEAARAFLAYLQGEEASAIFESVGFTPIH